HLISTTPGAGAVVGGIDDSARPLWNNYADVDLDPSDADQFNQDMETAWRECIRRGGMTPNFLLAGGAFIDAYREVATATVNRQVHLGTGNGNRTATVLDPSVGEGVKTGLFFKGKEIMWDPVL